MDFEMSDKIQDLRKRVDSFMDEHIFPRELEFGEFVEDHDNIWQYPPWFPGLKEKAKEAGIWNWVPAVPGITFQW